MKTKPVDIELLETNADYVMIKFPKLDIPVKMNNGFFKPRLERGHYRIVNKLNTQHHSLN